MDQDQCHRKLEESRRKLLAITKQLDNANGGEGIQALSEWGCIDQVVSSIEELQSLIAWIANKKGAPEDSSVIVQKLQQLSNIKKTLEKSAKESQQYLCHFEKDSYSFLELDYLPNKENCYSHAVGESRSAYNNNSVSYSPITTIPSPNSVYTPNFNSTQEQTTCYQPPEMYNKAIDVDSIDLYIKKLCSMPRSLMSQSLADLGRESDDHHDSLGTAISEDEGLGEESRKGDSTGPNSLLEISDHSSDSHRAYSCPPVTLRYKPSISPTLNPPEQDNWIPETCCHRNSIELCLATITKLKDSLQLKENEIQKLKNSNEPKARLPEHNRGVHDLRDKVDNLQTSVSILEKENASLKENLLELEEAENDARRQGQKLEEKLILLQQKDSHLQVEFAETKNVLKLCLEELSMKDSEERELHSRLNFMEILAQQYEQQLKSLELTSPNQSPIIDHENLESMLTVVENEVDSSKDSLKLDTSFFYIEKACQTEKEINSNVSVQTICSVKYDLKNCETQTEQLQKRSPADDVPTIICFGCQSARNSGAERENHTSGTCPVKRELFNQLHHLVREDASLERQLQQVDEINVSIWEKLHNLESHIEECEKEDESTGDKSSAKGKQPNKDTLNTDSLANRANTHIGLLNNLNSEDKLKERLSNLDEINSAFLKKLEMREKMYMEQEKRHEEWLKTEDILTNDLKVLGTERDSLLSQVSQLEAEKLELTTRVKDLEQELLQVRERHQQETLRITKERDDIMSELQQTIDELMIREREYMKQIANLKSSKNKCEQKSEFENLKSSYVQLQLELVGCRDKMESTKHDFDGRLDNLNVNHSVEESRLLCELGSFRVKDSDCDKKLMDFQTRQTELENKLKGKENELSEEKDKFRKQIKAVEEEHGKVEAELRKKLSEMEDGTAVATKALQEERARLEKELHENIEDLRAKEEQYKSRIAELESNVSQLHQELHRLTGNLKSKFESDVITSERTNFHWEHLLNELQELRVRESELREKLDEMEKKELAYRETLEHADRIVASVERGYRNKIEELEMSERCLKQRVAYLEEVESRLQVALQRERRSSDGRRPDDLVMELAEAEKRENNLKEEIGSLEMTSRTASQRVKELEKTQHQLEHQLSDREDLVSSLQKLQSEQDSIRKELMRLRKSENGLQIALHQTENLLSNREVELNSEMKRFYSDKRDLEETISQLRNQVRDLKEKMDKRLVDSENLGERLSKDLPLSIALRSQLDTDTSDSPNKDVEKDAVSSYSPPMSVKEKIKLIERQSTKEALSNGKTCELVAGCTETGKPSTSAKPLKQHIPSEATGITKAEKEYSEVRMQLEECMVRAMDAMKMEMEHKTSRNSPECVEPCKKLTVFPPPSNFHVIQQVGFDTLLVGWEYPEESKLEGFELYVNYQLHEAVHAPDRRKAVISGLDFSKSNILEICSVSSFGQVSELQPLTIAQKMANNCQVTEI